MALWRAAKLFLALLICAAFPALTPFAEAKPKGAETFQGTCEMSGVIHHEPPLTQTPTPTTVHGSFRGVCSGQLTDRKGRTRGLDEARATYRALGVGDLSCLGGVATGTGKLSLGRGSVIEFALTERRGPGVAEVTLEGESGGTATVFGTVSRDQDLIELNRRCMSSGVRLLRGDARIVSPGIAG
jgi:hypothetical protein